MKWIRPLSAEAEESAEVLGAKARGLVALQRLGLPVPPGFVVTTEACRAFLRNGHLPDGFTSELADAIRDVEAATGRRFGGPGRPLVVSVRSGAAVSMPGMMDTVLNLGLTAETTAALAAETGDARFAHAARQRFLSTFAAATADVDANVSDGIAVRDDATVPDDAARQLERALGAVFSSWHTERARTYRELHDVPHDLGTAVVVQAMVFGNRDAHSGSGVAFSRNPNTGENAPYGDVLFGHQGDDVVSGRTRTRPLLDLAEHAPTVWAALRTALWRIEESLRDACYVEFTFQGGELWFLQCRPARFSAAAAVRVATDLADAGTITREAALLRVTPLHLRHARTPRIAPSPDVDVLTRGVGACPGVAVGRVATTAETALRMAATGPVVLVRPETSPHDMPGLAAATGILTARGGPTSHAAVVARALGKPAVVGAPLPTGDRALREGTLITVDGTTGTVALGAPPLTTTEPDAAVERLLTWADTVSGTHPPEPEPRLAAAHAVLRDAG
ncbi:pyruvate, phosphate dikinase [Streptomyces sp. NPDC020412]|uniref:pyruvate, phosphate dikinase n=1 Tax=Streptomyces sp. NPDC020412 TaxID=3365073 RepID=UPI0037A2DFE7